MGIAARLTLLSAALGVTMAEDRAGIPDTVQEADQAAVPERPGASPAGVEGAMPGRAQRARARTDAEPARRRASVQLPGPAFGARSQDRVTLAAGIVLGAVGLVLARVLAGAVGTLRDLARRR